MEGVGGDEERGIRGSRADFPTVYMLILNLTALVLELFIHQMQIDFFSPFVIVFLWILDCCGEMLIYVNGKFSTLLGAAEVAAWIFCVTKNYNNNKNLINM